MLQGGMSSIAEATPTAKDRACLEVSQYELAPPASLDNRLGDDFGDEGKQFLQHQWPTVSFNTNGPPSRS